MQAKEHHLPYGDKVPYTDWIPGGKKPVRIGVYQRQDHSDNPRTPYSYAYWTGENWGLLSSHPKEAELMKGCRSVFQELPWRGLVK